MIVGNLEFHAHDGRIVSGGRRVSVLPGEPGVRDVAVVVGEWAAPPVAEVVAWRDCASIEEANGAAFWCREMIGTIVAVNDRLRRWDEVCVINATPIVSRLATGGFRLRVSFAFQVPAEAIGDP